MATVNYVKFMRGTQALYNTLTTKDSNTLYFVYENEGADHGKLYLGNKLISGGSSGGGGDIALSDIIDVAINAGLSDNNILVYDESTKKWVNTSLTDAIKQAAPMIGATATEDGSSGLVPTPEAGDQGKFLRGDGTWSSVEATLSEADRESIAGLKAQVATIIGDDKNKSARTIANEELTKQLIPNNAKESLNTLTEIANWIQTHPDDASAMNNNITILQTDVQSLKDVINGTVTAHDSGLSKRVVKLETSVGTLTPIEGKYVNVGEAVNYFNQSITSINDRLRWHELSEER